MYQFEVGELDRDLVRRVVGYTGVSSNKKDGSDNKGSNNQHLQSQKGGVRKQSPNVSVHMDGLEQNQTSELGGSSDSADDADQTSPDARMEILTTEKAGYVFIYNEGLQDYRHYRHFRWFGYFSPIACNERDIANGTCCGGAGPNGNHRQGFCPGIYKSEHAKHPCVASCPKVCCSAKKPFREGRISVSQIIRATELLIGMSSTLLASGKIIQFLIWNIF